ncbi:granulocyte-macrophage colony-stimulating factor receptor subunit alpha-like isoform X2 [Carettochelys insculpta]|uniref:granulocyte-macrophage colony-stimulating factor receptor subunit alpha-like isoform X2 n=1 Tax=Carettochelys insculpta TaxID=44489 RepID=UPI003EC156B1
MAATQGFVSIIWCIMFFPTWRAVFAYTESTSSFSPIANLTFNHRKLELTWDSSIAGLTYSCSMRNSEDFLEFDVNDTKCIFSVREAFPIHTGALFGVKGTYNYTPYSADLTFIPQGMNGTSVENFSCVIYNMSFMNCTWNAGRDAPEDTQYFLFLQYTREEDALPCPHYIRDALGRHIACSFQNVTVVKHNIYFLVNGSSKESEIQFYDKYIKLYDIEKLPPPLNTTVNCSEDQLKCRIQWKSPQLSHSDGNIDHCFEYQIDIQNKKTNANPNENSNELRTVQVPHFTFENYHVKNMYTLRIRAKGHGCQISKNWGEWSEPIEFGNPDDAVLMDTIILLLIALGTILLALSVFFLCKRRTGWLSHQQNMKPKK